MDIVQVINNGNQVFSAAGASVSGVFANLEICKGLLFRGILAGGFVWQQKKGINFFILMVIAAIFRFVETFSQRETGGNKARFVKLLESFKSGFARLTNKSGYTDADFVLRGKIHGQDVSTVVLPVVDSYWPKPWIR